MTDKLLRKLVPMDALVFAALVRELDSALAGAKIQRVDQPGANVVWLGLRQPGKNLHLVICAATEMPSIYLASKDRPARLPLVPPNFCMLLRRRLVGGRIERIHQPELERICYIEIAAGDDLGNPARWTLIAEVMGKRSNLVLVDSSTKIAGVLRPVGELQNRFRQLLPGLNYVAPPAVLKTHPRELVRESFLGCSTKALSCQQAVLETVLGFGPLVAQEVCIRAGFDPSSPFTPDAAEALAAAARQAWHEASHTDRAVVCFGPDGEPEWCHVLNLSTPCHDRQEFNSVARALELYYTTLEARRAFESRQRSLRQALESRVERISKRLAVRESELSAASQKDTYRAMGDLILTYLPQVAAAIEAHQEEIVLSDPATGSPVKVKLDLSMDAAANAQRYYKRYAKARSTQRLLEPQVEKDKAELAYLASVLGSLDLAQHEHDLDEIATELEQQGLLEHKPASSRSTIQRAPMPDRYTTSAGEEILVGKNNRQNDHLTLRLARPTDIWFHAKAVPGAHVVLRSSTGAVSDRSLLEAASLAATFSAARASTKVEVDYTQVKNVRKPPGSKPGMVIYDNYRTIVVRPDPALAESLKAQDWNQ